MTPNGHAIYPPPLDEANRRPSRDELFIRMAQLVATRATCLRRRVGCVLVNARGHVLSTGYNGTPAGAPHCNQPTGFNFVYANGIDKTKPLTGQATGSEWVFGNACAGAKAPTGTDLDACDAIHAEQNALLQCPDVWAINTCYCTTLPCVTCVKLLLNTSCKRIIYAEDYPKHTERVRSLWGPRGELAQFTVK